MGNGVRWSEDDYYAYTKFGHDAIEVLTEIHFAPTIDPESLRPKGEWISVKDRLPEEKEYVMIWCGECQIARIEKGISKEQREAMKRGELDDPCESGWALSTGYFTLKRSQAYKACDEQGNNSVPYCWYPNGGPMSWFGQNVTHWMPLPKPPNCCDDMRGNPNDS